MRTPLSFLVLLAIACLGVCGSAVAAATSSGEEEAAPITFPKIDRHPSAADWSGMRGAMTSVPHYDPESDEGWPMDLRAYDLSDLDLGKSLSDLLYATFDDKTVWPPDDRMPRGFDRQRIMELGKNPGLGIRALHKQGITGRGVGIAVIDQPLLTKHQEYVDRLRLYEEINIRPDAGSSMHGPAVASIAVGKTVGVAPGADLYFIGSYKGDFGVGPDGYECNLSYRAQAVRRILAVNDQLPEGRKIRVISMSMGWGKEDKGYDELTAAIEKAKSAGMLIVSSVIDDVHGFDFMALGRAPLSDPDAFESHEPWLHIGENFFRRKPRHDLLLVPTDSRTTACPQGIDQYVFYRQGGFSWAIPYIAGVYALAAQVDPEITPERFWSLAMKTGRTIELEHDGKKVRMRPIVDPGAIIAALENK